MIRNSVPYFLGRCAGALLVLSLLVAAARAESPPLEVSGLGWLGNRGAVQTLKLLLGSQRAAPLEAGPIEDAALILIWQLNDEGYLQPTVTVRVRHADGAETEHPLDAEMGTPLPRPLGAVSARLQIEKGPRFAYRDIEFTGLVAVPEAAARSFFVGESMLVALNNERAYSPSRLSRGLGNLREELLQQGYADATVQAADLQLDRATGEVRLRVAVREGAQRRVAAVNLAASPGAPVPPAELTKDRVGKPWSMLWNQDLETALRRWYFHRGYPDVQVFLKMESAPAAEGLVAVTVAAEIAPGPLVHLGVVRFAGNVHTKEAPLRRLVRVPNGGLFDPVKFDSGQSRLARLGTFRTVGYKDDPAEGETRDVVYEVVEGRRQEVNLLAGYGSYEQLRGGIEWRHFNLWGLAHTDSLQVVESMKSSRGTYTYTVPELFGSTLDGSVRLFGLHREDLSFTRDEFGVNASVQWPWRARHAQLTTGYTLQRLSITHNDLATEATDLDRVNATSLNFGIVQDRRDDPLSPHRGTKLFAQVDLASRRLGGDVDYQQLRIGGSYHTSWGHGRWLHLGLAHGVVLTLGANDDRHLPVNVLYFPGGDGSIRGYNAGEAAPRVANGQFVGAKSYVLLNVELEQALTSRWSVVVFGDALGIAARIADYPFSEELYSVGGGVRYRTPIGPVRLEYGHNLNPRLLDPSGTLQISIGVPF
jgi:outer membrane protein assembly complex protein YaeT